jgi:hypothetical protein
MKPVQLRLPGFDARASQHKGKAGLRIAKLKVDPWSLLVSSGSGRKTGFSSLNGAPRPHPFGRQTLQTFIG